jgi:hypothetical protein
MSYDYRSFSGLHAEFTEDELARLHQDGRPRVWQHDIFGVDRLLEALVRAHGRDGRPDLYHAATPERLPSWRSVRDAVATKDTQKDDMRMAGLHGHV